MHLNLLDILGIVTAFQLLFLSVYLLSYKLGHRVRTKLLLAFLFVNAVIVIKFIIFHSGILPDDVYPPIHVVGSGLYLLLAQLLYFYTKKLESERVVWKRIYALHALPFVLIVIGGVFTYHLFPAVYTSPAFVSGRIVLIHGMLFGYILATFFLVRHYRADLKEHFSSSEHVDLGWLNLLLAAFFLMWLVDVLIIGLLLTGLRSGFWSDGLTALSLLINLYFATRLVYRGLKQPSLFTGIEIVSISKSSELPKAQTKRYIACLQEIMLSEKPFLEPMLSIHDLAEKTSIPVRHLSRVINDSLKQNFFDFIGDYRIEEAKRRLADPTYDDQTVLRILYDSGFNSKSSFNMLFKKKTGLTPSEFRRRCRESASEN